MAVIKETFQKFYSGKKILITGETGFKGSWLAIWLHHLGASVYGISLDPTADNENYNVCNLSALIKHKTIDIRNNSEVINTIKQLKPDIIFHLAAQALVSESYKSPRETFDINIMGTINILEAIRETPSIKIGIMITSDKCYASQEWFHGYRENDPLGGNDPYSASKGACEIVVQSYQKSFFNTDTSPGIATVRAGNVIGGGDRSLNRIVPDCIRAIESGEKLILRSPDAVRPWQHVLEPLSGYILLGYLLGQDKKRFTGAWNFGPLYANIISVKELVELIISTSGKGSYECKERGSSDFSETSILMLDISLAVMLLKWHPALSIQETIQWTLDGYNIRELFPGSTYQQRVNHIETYMEKMNQKTRILL